MIVDALERHPGRQVIAFLKALEDPVDAGLDAALGGLAPAQKLEGERSQTAAPTGGANYAFRRAIETARQLYTIEARAAPRIDIDMDARLFRVREPDDINSI